MSLPGTHDPLGRALLRAAIEELVVENSYLLDRGRFDDLVELYTEECEVQRPLPPFTEPRWETIRGRAALRESYRDPAAWPDQPRRMRHVCTNLRVVARGDDRIEGTVTLTGYRHEGEGVAPAHPMMVGDYEDEYRRGADGRWRIHRRKVVIEFLNEDLVGRAVEAAKRR